MSLSLLSSESDDDGMRRGLATAVAPAVGLVLVRCRASSLDDDDDSESDDVNTARADLLDVVAVPDTRAADSVEHLRLGSVDRDPSSSLESCTRDLPTLLRRRLLACTNIKHPLTHTTARSHTLPTYPAKWHPDPICPFFHNALDEHRDRQTDQWTDQQMVNRNGL